MCPEKFTKLNDIPDENICLQKAPKSQLQGNGQGFFKRTFQQKCTKNSVCIKKNLVYYNFKFYPKSSFTN
jgi:hypothetical protein